MPRRTASIRLVNYIMEINEELEQELNEILAEYPEILEEIAEMGRYWKSPEYLAEVERKLSDPAEMERSRNAVDEIVRIAHARRSK